MTDQQLQNLVEAAYHSGFEYGLECGQQRAGERMAQDAARNRYAREHAEGLARALEKRRPQSTE